MSEPTVSCIVPAYNVGPYVAAALESALALDWPADRLQIIAVNDGSTDDTGEVLARYADRVEIVTQENKGFIAAVNAGLERVRGDYVGLLDGDDEWPADRLRLQVAALEAAPAVGLVHGDMEIVDTHGNVLDPSFFRQQNLAVPEGDVFGPVVRGNFVSGGASLFRASFLDRLRPIPPEAAWPDWWIATRIAEVAQIRTVPGVFNRYRQHGANMGLNASPEQFARRKVEEIRFRRWILRELAGSRASVADLLACFGALELHAAQIGAIEGRPMTSAIEVSDAEHAAADERYAHGLELARAGDTAGAARTFLQALGHDPWHGRARAEAHFTASRLGESLEVRGPIPAATVRADGPPTVSIVIPVYGKLDLTRQCLEAIDATCAGVPHEVIVVDNASPDGTAAFLRAAEAEGRLRAICNEQNLGFGKACNAGAAIARGEHVLLLNNDTIPHPGWLEALLAGLDDPTVGLVGARLLYADGTIQHAGVNFTPSLLTEHVHRGAAADDPAVLEARDYPAVTGACILLSKRLWDEIGGLDEGYQHYVEDIDLCMHVWERGLRVRYIPESVVTHLEQQSAPNRAWIDALVEEGWRRFYRRWSTRWPQAVRDLSPVELPQGTRSFAVVALARDLIEQPQLISAYAASFAPEDDATLVVYDDERDSTELAVALGPTLAAAGLDETGPDMLAFGRRVDGDVLLSLTTHALLGDSEPQGALSRLPRFGSGQVEALRAAAEATWSVAA